MPSIRTVLCLLIASAVSVYSADIYVDAINGSDADNGLSAGTACRTLGFAIGLVESVRTQPGTTQVHLAPGNYGEMNWTLPGDFTGEVVWRGDRYGRTRITHLELAGDSCVARQTFRDISFHSVAGNSHFGIINGNGLDYLTIRDSEIFGEHLYDSEGIRMSASHHITVDNCYIHDVVHGFRFNGIDYDITRNRFDRIPGSPVSTFCGGYLPIWPRSAMDVVIAYNDFQHPSGDYPDEPGYQGYDEPAELHASVISIRGADFTIDHNVFHNIFETCFIQFYGGDCGAPDYEIEDIVITNNIGYANTTCSGLLHVPGDGEPDGPVIIENNTMIGTSIGLVLDSGYAGSGTVVRNNLVYGALTGAVNHQYQDYDDPAAEWVTEHNLAKDWGWELNNSKIDPSNLFTDELIAKGDLPADFWDTGIFLDADYTKESANSLTSFEERSRRWIPQSGCIACTAGTGGGYVGAIPCLTDSEAVASILAANGDSRTVNQVATINGSGRVTELYLQNDAGGTVFDVGFDIGRLTELTVLHVYGPAGHDHASPYLVRIDPAIGNCTALTELQLQNNDLTALPEGITDLTGLTYCDIGNNRLYDIGSTVRTWLNTYDPDWEFSQGLSDVPVAMPSIGPAGGTYDDSVVVSLDCPTYGAAIRYTTDGTDPTGSSALYTDAFTLKGSATVAARAFKSGRETSLATSAVYTVVIDTFVPDIYSVTIISDTSLLLRFTEPVNRTDLVAAGNISVAGLTVLDVIPGSDGISAIIGISPMVPDSQYTVQVGSIRDLAVPANTGTGLSFTIMYRTIDDLAVYLKLDGDLADSSGNGYSGSWYNGASFGDGITGRAIAPAAGSTYATIALPGPVKLESIQAVTLCAWAKKSVASTGGRLIYRHVIFGLSASAAGGSGSVSNEAGQSATATGDAGTGDTLWHHYATTYDGSFVRLFIDGSLAAESPQTGLVRGDQPGRDINLGTYPFSVNYFNGLIDEVRIYDWALSPAQIAEVFQIHGQASGVHGRTALPDAAGGIAVFPNPAQGMAIIAAAGPVEIFDMNGRLVKSVYSDGSYHWDGTGMSGNRVENGLFFIRAAGSVTRIMYRN